MRDRLIELIKNAPRNTRAFYDQFADYLLENGVIVLPCKVSDTLYDIGEFFDGTPCPEKYRLRADYITLYDKYPDRKEKEPWFTIDGMDYKFSDFGKTVFLTRKEAEQALKGGEG